MSLTYDAVGATRAGTPPAGHRRLGVRHRLGPGTAADLARVGEDLLAWRVHAAAGVRLRTGAPRAAPGVDVEALLGLGRARVPAPCTVVWTVADARRVGFAYGTRPGHVFSGEEAFVVERDAAGDLWFVVRAFSRPVHPLTRALGPAVPVGQRAFVALLALGARRRLRRGRAA
ncbi:DUF1990 family protein [Cellulomonas endophytica]|uniref:DUF1990 family protein n=1 Tax=Cellulomonas endophytica TaxID=2494735 RepID=UPI0010114F5B|nr:DUF1990 domain-containing protein [Cellulomonas endophytica]